MRIGSPTKILYALLVFQCVEENDKVYDGKVLSIESIGLEKKIILKPTLRN
jgi:hypothetical protein